MARSVLEAGFDAGGDAIAGAADPDFLGRDGVVARTFDDLDRNGRFATGQSDDLPTPCSST